VYLNWGEFLDFAQFQWRWWGVSRIFGQFMGGVIGTPVFFCFNHSSRNAARPLCIRCASTAHPLRIHCASNHFEGVKPLY
jgi:hypothetical protein